MVCVCVGTLRDMWLDYILYRSNLSAHCVWQISGMGAIPTLYLEELAKTKVKLSCIYFCYHVKISYFIERPFIIEIFFFPLHPGERNTSPLRTAQWTGAESLAGVATTWLNVCEKVCNMSSVRAYVVPISEGLLHLLKATNEILCISGECNNVSSSNKCLIWPISHNEERCKHKLASTKCYWN